MKAEHRSTKFSKAEVEENSTTAAELTTTKKSHKLKHDALMSPAFSSALPLTGFSVYIQPNCQMTAIYGEITDHQIKFFPFPVGKNP